MIELNDFPELEALKRVKKRFKEMDLSALRVWVAVLQTAGQEMKTLDSILEKNSLARSRFFMLLLLFRYEKPMQVKELADGIGVSTPTATGLLERMKKQGLVKKHTSTMDARARMIQITEKGKELLAAILPEHYGRVSEMARNLSEKERDTLISLLARFGKDMETSPRI